MSFIVVQTLEILLTITEHWKIPRVYYRDICLVGMTTHAVKWERLVSLGLVAISGGLGKIAKGLS